MPFYLRTGKRLGRRVTEIAVVFKRAPHLPFDATMTEELGQNALVIRVQPDEGITLRFGSKVPGHAMEVRDVNMDFSYGPAFTEASPEAYERLILDVLLGEPSLFPVNAEVELSWEILDPALEYWAVARQTRPVRVGRLGAGFGVRDAAAHGRTGEAVRALREERTDDRRSARRPPTTAVNKKLVDLREEGGAFTMAGCSRWSSPPTARPCSRTSIEAANAASREHPCRVIVVLPATETPPTPARRADPGRRRRRRQRGRGAASCHGRWPTTPAAS